MYPSTILPLLSLLSTTTAIALPRMGMCIADTCQPTVHYGQPTYSSWARELVRRWKNGEPTGGNDTERATLQDTKGNEVETVLRGVSTDDPEEPWAGVYYCEDNAWGGACKHVYSPLGGDPEKCTMIDGRVSSAGPDPGYYCIFYTNALCAPIASNGSDSLILTYPGTDNLSVTEKGDFNDRLLSYNCFKEEDFSLSPPELGTPPNVVGGNMK